MGTEAEAYRYLHDPDNHESNWPAHKRAELPWHHPYAIPYFRGDATHCRHGDCKDTNWGGFDRVHARGIECPPIPEYKGRHRANA